MKNRRKPNKAIRRMGSLAHNARVPVYSTNLKVEAVNFKPADVAVIMKGVAR